MANLEFFLLYFSFFCFLCLLQNPLFGVISLCVFVCVYDCVSMSCLQLVLQNEFEIAVIYKEFYPGKSQRVVWAISDKCFPSLCSLDLFLNEFIILAGRYRKAKADL